MTRQEVKTLTTQGGILKVWNDKNGTIWYRYKENKNEILTTFMVRTKKGKYVITPTEDETYILYRGTKKNCLVWMSGYIEVMLNCSLKK
nr:MAG TPA: hypothetical protein [Microviridae sp.]